MTKQDIAQCQPLLCGTLLDFCSSFSERIAATYKGLSESGLQVTAPLWIALNRHTTAMSATQLNSPLVSPFGITNSPFLNLIKKHQMKVSTNF